jgi:peptide/nickel transport system permease protein
MTMAPPVSGAQAGRSSIGAFGLATSHAWGPRGRLRIVVREFRRNRGATVGAVVLGLLILVGFCAPILAPHDPVKVVTGDSLKPPSFQYLLGADLYGRDVFSRLIFGTRISLAIGVVAVGIGAGIGVPVGLIAGWMSGSIDVAITRVTDAMLAMPGILLALSIITVLGPGLNNAVIAVGIASIPTYVRLVRGCVLATKENAYVDAARVLGCSTGRIMFRHLLPNVVVPIIVLSSLAVGTAILSAAGLSFLGLGAQAPTPEWGLAVSDGRDYLETAWWISTFPSLAIMIAVFSVNLLGDGLRDALDPRLHGR